MRDKTGYLREPLKIFYVADQTEWNCPYHYHDFHKITLFLQGEVTYDIEGKSYHLQPYDIVVVRAGQLHRPLISGKAVYDRIIAYISRDYLETYAKRGCDLSLIFKKPPSAVLRQPQEVGSVYNVSCRLRQVCTLPVTPLHTLLRETLFLEFLLYVAQAITNGHLGYVKTGRQNEKIRHLLTYITEHLTGDLSVPTLAAQAYVSPDYLMHLFKEETGSSIGTYITAKRLQRARLLLEQQVPLTTVCYDSGFKNYSTFYRAWKKQYGVAPKAGLTVLPPLEGNPLNE